MNDNPEPIDRYIEASAAMLAISIRPEWLATVREALTATKNAVALVEAFPLEDEAEPAPVFRP
jgi:deoxyribose-phosphate aldolase